MKKHLQKPLLVIACLLCSIAVYAQYFEVDGIYYNKLSATEVEVAPDYINFCSYIGDVIIPETVEIEGITYNVTSIGEWAFYNCTGLTELTIPNSVTSIGDYAFLECINLTKATIGKSVTSIGEEAFSNCNGLTQIYCQATTPPVISEYTFENYSARLYVPIESMDAYKSADYWKKFTNINRNLFVDGLYYNILSPTDVEVTYKDTNYNSYAGEIIIPETVEIEGITFNVTSIGENAFCDCTGLTSVTIGNSVTSIGSSAFKDCTGLTEVTIPNSVTSIGMDAFRDCTGLTSVTIGNSVTEIGFRAFSGCTGLTEITIPNSVTEIGYQAFYDCSGLTEVTIPNSVTSIGMYAFGGCTGLTTVNFNAENCTTMGYSSNPVFNGCTNLSTINIGENVKTIPSYAFWDCTGLTEITIPNSVTSIGDYAFYKCDGLTSVTIGNSVSSIGNSAFEYCTGLTEITIPNSVTWIGEDAFTICTGLTTVNFNAENCTTMGSSPNPVFSGYSNLIAVNIGESVKIIPDYAFEYCAGLTEVTIPNSVTSIGASAFLGCTGLTSVTIGNSVTSIGWSAFLGCTGLTSVTIGNSVTSIGNYAFSGCTRLKEVTIPNSVTSIGDHAFYNCEALRTVTIGSDVTKIGDRAFDKCDRIKEVYAHPTVPPVIGSHTFTVYVNDNATLYLYKESQEAYAKANYWEYFVKIGTIKKEYTLTYMVDDTLYAQEYYFEGDTITPIAEPEKENYIFSGWSEIPEIMPSHDVTVTGSFMEVVFDSVINDTVSSFIVNKEMYCDELIYIRDFDNTDWQAWYVPFEVDYTTIAYDFEVACINNVHQYDQNNDGEMDLTELEAVKMQEGVLKANYPYIVKAHSTGVKQVILNNATLQPTEVCNIDCSSVSLRYTFTGTYNAMTGSELMQNGCYALQYNMLEAPTEESALGAFRWYMQIEQRSGDNNAVPQCIVLKVKEDFTDIENVMNNTDNAPVEYYDLSGRRVVEPTSGIYIVKQGNTVRKVVINK